MEKLKRTEAEFADGTVKDFLGDAFIQGEKYPILASSPADYTKVDKAIAAAKAIDGSRYTNYDAVEAAVKAVDRTNSKAEQDEQKALLEREEKLRKQRERNLRQ